MAGVDAGATEVRRVDDDAAGVDLDDERVGQGAAAPLKRGGRDREVRGRGGAGHVGVADRIDRDAEALVDRGAAEVRGVPQNGVDDEGPRRVPRRDPEAHAPAVEHVAAVDGTPLTVLLLVNRRPAQPHLAGRRRDQEIALLVEPQAVGTVEGQRHHARVRAGSHDEVVLELTLAAIEDEADPGVDVAVADAGEGRHVAAPAARLADEVMRVPGQAVEAGDRGGGLGPHQAHADDRRRTRLRRGERAAAGDPGVGRGQHQHGLARREEEAVTAAASEELHPGVGLAFVGLERQGQRAAGPQGRCRPGRGVRRTQKAHQETARNSAG